jgi:hypothetical protein
MGLSPNLKFPSKEGPQITEMYLHAAAYPSGHKKLVYCLISHLSFLAQTGLEMVYLAMAYIALE